MEGQEVLQHHEVLQHVVRQALNVLHQLVMQILGPWEVLQEEAHLVGPSLSQSIAASQDPFPQ